ncbi:MAG: glycosyltransferase [Christensenellaceae bacterium]|nr:glycosyltransferase [Christensenellaceae bacterium]
MKILIINSVCGIRSTGRICTDLATAVEAEGHEVKIGYGREAVPEQYKKYAIRIGGEIDVKLHGLKARLMDADGKGSSHATRKFLEWVQKYDPDVIHLHNLHGYYINVPLLFQYIIDHNKKVIWTLHDMWSFTGHSGTCDSKKCEKWETGCGNCPSYKGYPSSIVDRSAKNYLWKKNLFTAVENLTIVTPSKWLAGLVKRSFLSGKIIEIIPNGIDIQQFKPQENDFKSFYHIEDKIVLMGCSTWWGKNKGLNDFYTLAARLDQRYKIVLVGLDKEQIAELPSAILGIERTNSVKELAQIYSAADLFVNLTYGDNYPTVNLESLACGTPVLTYETGGSAECLDGKNGISFTRGDIEGVIKFLNTEFTSDKFTVSSQPKIDKKTAAFEYMIQFRGVL